MSDPSARTAPEPRDPLTLLRPRANRSERGRKVFPGVQQGLLLGFVAGLADVLRRGSDPWISLVYGTVIGTFFGSFMALAATPPRPRASRDPAVEAAIAPEVPRTATDRLIIGRPGAEANRVAALPAEQVLSAPSARIPAAVAFLVGAVCAPGALALPSGEAPDFPHALLGTVALACALIPCLMLPVQALHRRRSGECPARHHTPSGRG